MTVVTDAADPGCVPFVIAHAALLATGKHRGKVLLWNASKLGENGPPCNVAVTWLFDPEAPTDLIVIDQPLDSNIFCGAGSWESSGDLIVVGGQSPGEPPTFVGYPKQSYRFRPGLLGRIDTSGTYPAVNLVRPPWQRLGDNQFGLNYPGLLQLFGLSLQSACTSSPYLAGGTFMLGGRRRIVTSTEHEGMEVWEFLNSGASAWSCPLIPGLPGDYPIADYPFVDHSGLIPANVETVGYAPKKSGSDSANYPEVDLDTYPRAFQISTGEIVNTGDLNKISTPCPTTGTGNYPTNQPGHAWVVKPRYSSLGVQDWELWRAPEGVIDRQFGSAVLMHTIDDNGNDQLDRILVFGGRQEMWDFEGCLGGDKEYAWLSSVKEFETNGDAVDDGEWSDKSDLLFPRDHLCAVLLPTGEVFIQGGDHRIPPCEDPPVPGDPPCEDPPSPAGPQFVPELYDPGRAPSDPSSSFPLAQSNHVDPADCPQPPKCQIPRLNHQVSVLLADGRVLVAGGDDFGSARPASSLNAEIFEPPYLHQGFRPAIVNAPPSAAFSTDSNPNPNTYEILVSITSGNSVERVVLIRPTATTHNFDLAQRYIEQHFLVSSVSILPGAPAMQARLEVEAPDERLGPDGWYMLFVVERDAVAGALVPSVAEFIHFQ